MHLIKRVIYITTGLLATALGILGVWLPGLPTTPFLLIALWAFSNSSARLHQWLLKVPLLKTALKEAHRFQRERTLDIRIKIIAQACAWTSFLVILLTLNSPVTTIIVGLLAISCSVFTYLTPTHQKPVAAAASAKATSAIIRTN